MNRREFSYVTALAGLALPEARAEQSAAASATPSHAAGLITEMVFLDDCVRIGMYDPELSNAAKTALTTYPDFLHSGALWPDGQSTNSGEVFALSAGHLCSGVFTKHRQPDSPEARLYQDIAVMRDMAEKTYCDPSKPAPVGDLLNLIHTRRRLGLHTYNPDPDIQPWLEGIIHWWKDERDLRASLAAAYTAPNPSKVREYVSDFYNRSDPLIRLARRFEFSEVLPLDALRPALDQASRGSHYARALKESIEGLRSIQPPA